MDRSTVLELILVAIDLANMDDVVKLDNLLANARRLGVATHSVIATRLTKSTPAFKQPPDTMQGLKGGHMLTG
jgi:hypothetical protein